jgi:carboxyl-terminal processing protease
VHLVVLRGDETLELDVMRDVVQIPSVRSEMLEDHIAYVRLNRFADRSPEEMQAALEEVLAENPQGLILDLRNNPGGGLESAVDIADQFLKDGVVLTERFGTGRERVFRASDEGLVQDIPLVVLINEGSASASEVLAGAIRDHQRGILLGETSFGKGTVQTWHALSNGGGVRITTARWLTPDGDWVHGEGLTPDVVVPAQDIQPGQPAEDDQLQAAVEQLHEMMGQPSAATPEAN